MNQAPSGRWVEQQDETEEARAGSLLRQAETQTRGENVDLDAVYRRLQMSAPQISRPRPWFRGVVLGLAISGAATAWWGIRIATDGADPEVTDAPSGQTTTNMDYRDSLRLVPEQAAPTDAPVEAEAADENEAVEVETAEPAETPKKSHTSSNPPVAAPAAQQTSLAKESALLGQAMKKLRQGNDPAGALRVLAQYSSEFPRGKLAAEAQVTRVEALMATGRKNEALTILDSMSLSSGRWLTLRAELRAAGGRCADAVSDYDRVLGGGVTPRALYGRGSCKQRLGDAAGASRDFRSYLDRFPKGPNAAQVRAALK